MPGNRRFGAFCSHATNCAMLSHEKEKGARRLPLDALACDAKAHELNLRKVLTMLSTASDAASSREYVP